MGGGASFSSGGPGKGLYTRIYQNILGRYPFDQLTSNLSLFSDDGIYFMYGQCNKEHVGTIIQVMINQFREMRDNPPIGLELDRAKNQLCAYLGYHMENRMVCFEDLALQSMVYNGYRGQDELISKIQSVSSNDISKVFDNMLKSNPSVCYAGNALHYVPPFTSLQQWTQQGTNL